MEKKAGSSVAMAALFVFALLTIAGAITIATELDAIKNIAFFLTEQALEFVRAHDRP